MPTYLYKNLETGEVYELKQSMRDEAYTQHPETGAPVKRVVSRPAIAFKGSGFYANDSRASTSRGGSRPDAPKTEGGAEGKADSGSAGAEGKSAGSGDSGSAGAKAESGSASKAPTSKAGE